MKKQSFNAGWEAGLAQTGLDALMGRPADKTAVTLPHDIVRDLERRADVEHGSHTGFYPGGVFEYQKKFAAPAEWAEGAVLLEFEGVYRDAIVRVNQDLVAHRPNGYAGFTVDLGPFLRFGEDNVISVTSRSHDDSRWYTGAGIYRPTWLHTGPAVHLVPDGVQVTSSEIEQASAIATVAVQVRNTSRHTSTVRVRTRVQNASGSTIASRTTPVTTRAGEDAVARLRHTIPDPALWSPDSPALYRVITELLGDDEQVLDDSRETFGIRRLQLDSAHGLRVNGTEVKLRGACIHHDNGPLGSATFSRAEERRVELLKAAGYNAIRSAHNPISRAMLEACDRLGVLVMDELSDVWTQPKTPSDYSIVFAQEYARDLESMVSKDFNHPSVILYSIGNEIPDLGRPLGARWGRLLAEKVRALDPTRYVTNALNTGLAVPEATPIGEGGAFDINEILWNLGNTVNTDVAGPEVDRRMEESFSVLDVAGVNYAEYRYAYDREHNPDRVLMGSETFPGRLDVLWDLIDGNGNVIGDFAWTGWDYLGETGIGRQFYDGDPNPPQAISTGYPWLTASCGTIDITGRRRPISFWREFVWGLRTQPYIAVQDPADHGRTARIGPWSWFGGIDSWTWQANSGAPVAVEVYSDADEIELLLNGAPVARAAVGTDKGYVARLEARYEPGELTAVAYRAGREVARSTLRTAGSDLQVVASADRSVIRADDSDLAYIDLALTDGDGLVNPLALQPITVTVDGPGVLAGFGTAQPDPTEAFNTDTRTPFQGRALAIVRPTGEGDITITASAGDIGTTTVTVEARAVQE